MLDAIDALLPRRVFRETGNAGRVEFVHDLLRELPYGDLSAARRRALHRRAGEALEHRCERGSSVPAAVLADHFLLADEGDKAFRYLLDAGAAACEAGAYGDALVHLNKAQACLPPDGSARGPLSALGAPGPGQRGGEADGPGSRMLPGGGRAGPRRRLARDRAGRDRRDASAEGRASSWHERRSARRSKRPVAGRRAWPLDLARSLVGVALPVRGPRRSAPSTDPERFRVAVQANHELSGVASSRVDTIGAFRAALRGLAMAKEAGDPDELALAYARFVLRFAMHSGRLVGRRVSRSRREVCRGLSFAGEPGRRAQHDRESPVTSPVTWIGRSKSSGREALARTPFSLANAHGIEYLRRAYTHLGQFEDALTVSRAQAAIGEQTGSIIFRVGGEFGVATVLAHTGEYREAIDVQFTMLERCTGEGSPFLRPVAVVRPTAKCLLLASLYEDARRVLEEAVVYLSQEDLVHRLGPPELRAPGREHPGPDSGRIRDRGAGRRELAGSPTGSIVVASRDRLPEPGAARPARRRPPRLGSR